MGRAQVAKVRRWMPRKQGLPARPVLLRPQCAFRSPGKLVKMLILIP